jgi:Family of unknown function (DUF6510)
MTQMLDGNTAAGALSEIFAVDVTAARGRCVTCGAVDALGEVQLYFDVHGMIARCPHCEGVVFRMMRSPDRAWLDLRGLVSLEIPMPPESRGPAST